LVDVSLLPCCCLLDAVEDLGAGGGVLLVIDGRIRSPAMTVIVGRS